MSQKKIVIGVTGSIAAYKALDIVSNLKKRDFDVYVIMTKSACKFVNPLSFQSLSQNIVISDMFQEPKAWELQHISLAKKADLMLIAPATANIIGKIAGGIADDMLSTTVMATKAPVVFCPAMNTNMYHNNIVKSNIDKLKKFGYDFISPASGRLACGDTGEGKLADVNLICEYIYSKLYDIKDLSQKKVLVTAGPTISKIDPVRYITNRSSGKMGYEIAKEARDRGAKVTLISGPTCIPEPFGIDVKRVDTNEDMYNAIVPIYEDQDIVIKAAAVADYKPEAYSEMKIKKSEDYLDLRFVKDRDILKELGRKKSHQILVGFAAESNDLIENAKGKLEKKNLDMIVANNIMSRDTGFASDMNEVSFILRDGSIVKLDKMTKRQVAREIFNRIVKKR